jgi:hypothetical protein
MKAHDDKKKQVAHEVKPKGKHGGKRISTKPKCGAQTNETFNGGRPCLQPAGFGTQHVGVGRCKLHGGNNRIKHELYSKVMPAVYRESYLAAREHEDPKSMMEHIAVLDGFVLPAAIARGTALPRLPGLPDPLETQMQAIDIKSKVLKRMADIEDRGKIKMTEKEMATFVLEVVAIVSEYVSADVLKKIAARFGVRAMEARLVNG